MFTIEFTANQLHAQGAGPAANHGDDADVLGHDRRVEKVGLRAVVIYVAHKNLQHTDRGDNLRRLKKKKLSAGTHLKLTVFDTRPGLTLSLRSPSTL